MCVVTGQEPEPGATSISAHLQGFGHVVSVPNTIQEVVGQCR